MKLITTLMALAGGALLAQAVQADDELLRKGE